MTCSSLQVLIEAKEQQKFEASWGHYSLSQVCHDYLGSAEQTPHNVSLTEHVLVGRLILSVKLLSQLLAGSVAFKCSSIVSSICYFDGKMV
mmetsp:Transcript_26135/g.38711  ORF Transcript_26135/g.38711 Transcript_26135/m.38711 type:complete len:91 (+) Transcript_26135:175-447(+)